MRHNESGSAIVYILIAILLLAALTFYVMQGSRTGASSLTKEQASLAATEIIEYGDVVARAVQKLKLRGCSDTQISFEGLDSHWAGQYDNSNAPSDNSCHVFDLNGGGINTYTVPDNFMLAPWGFTYSGMEINGEASVEDLGTSAAELILWAYELNTDICENINEKANLSAPTVENMAPAFSTEFVGSYGLLADNIGDDSPTDIYKGQLYGCVLGSSLDKGHFYQVLLVR